jgi:NitT/TauT family transport system substrate-binding protein
MLMADYGVALYGNVDHRQHRFRRGQPRGGDRLPARRGPGLRDAAADPAAGVAAIAARNPALDSALELERLEIALRDNILTDWVMENGWAISTPSGMALSLEQIAHGL